MMMMSTKTTENASWNADTAAFIPPILSANVRIRCPMYFGFARIATVWSFSPFVKLTLMTLYSHVPLLRAQPLENLVELLQPELGKVSVAAMIGHREHLLSTISTQN